MEENIYYAYKEDGKNYYYNVKTQKPTWDFPDDGIVIDPETNEILKRQHSSTRRRTSTTMVKKSKSTNEDRVKGSDNKNKVKLNTDQSTDNETKNKRRTMRLKTVRTIKKKKVSKQTDDIKITIFNEDGKPLYYPKEIDKDAEGKTVDDLFEYIIQSKKGRKSSQSRIFQDKPIIVTFLKIEKNQTKNALLIFKTILKYQGVKDSKKVDGTIGSFIEYIHKDTTLINEAYLYVLKQTNSKKYDDAFRKGLELFLVLVDTFMPTNDFFPYILSHIAKIYQKASNENLKKFAFYIYLRCKSQFLNETPIVVPVNNILSSPTNSRIQFNISLNEIMWNQKETYPKLPLPVFIIKIISELVKKDCAHTQGIFRLSGNTNNLDKLKENANSGDFSFLESCDIHDISSLFKSWLRNISGSIIPDEFVPLIENNKKSPNIEVVNSLPVLNKNVLMYLVGFLQKQQQTSDETMMDTSNLAMVFSPNIVRQDDDPSINVRLTSHTQSFIEFLIH